VRWQQNYALGERRRREDTKSVGSPTTQRNVVRGQAGIVTARSAGAISADAARRGAVDIADHAGPGVVPRRAKRGGGQAGAGLGSHRRAQRGGIGRWEGGLSVGGWLKMW